MNRELVDAVRRLEPRQGGSDAAVVSRAVERDAHAEVAMPTFYRVQSMLQDGKGSLKRKAVPNICPATVVGHG
jgi:hypothetical protein